MMLPSVDSLHVQSRGHSGNPRSGGVGVPWSHCGSRRCPNVQSFAGTRWRSAARSTDRRLPCVVRTLFEFRGR
jgi:hypothetical protein